MTTLIAKNDSGSEKIFLSTILPDGEQITLTDYYTVAEIYADTALAGFIASGEIVLNDGANDLSPVQAIEAGNGVTKVAGKTPDAEGNVDITGDDVDDGASAKKLISVAEQAKLAAIENNATADQTGSEIKIAYELEADTNAYTDAEKFKLAGIELGATADQTDNEIKSAYENNADTNAFTDSEKGKLSGIETGAQVNQTDDVIKTQYENNPDTNAFTDIEQSKLSGIEDAAEVNQSDSEIKVQYENNANTNALTDALKIKLEGIEAAATGDPTDLEIKVAYESNADTNAFTDNEKVKLAGLESSHFKGEFIDLATLQLAYPTADVGDYANVDAGAASDIERYVWDDSDSAWVKQLGVSSLLTDAQVKTQYENNPDTNVFDDSEKSKLAGIELLAEANQSDSEIKTQYENNADTNAYTDAEQTKLAGIETGATGDLTAGEIKTLYESNPQTNEFNDTEKSKLSGIELGATGDQLDSEIKLAYNNEVPQVSQVEAEAGVITDDRRWTPERVRQAAQASTIFGSEYDFQESTGESTNGTATWVTKVTLTIPSAAPTGSYYLGVATLASHSNTTGDLGLRVQVNAVTVGEVITKEFQDALNYEPMSTNTEIDHTTGADTVITFQFNNENGGTAAVKQSRLTTWRVS